jgi:hypothetical protein
VETSVAGDSLGSLIEGPIESFIKKNAATVKSNSGTKNGDLRPMTARQRVTKDDLLHSEESFVD